MAPHPVKHPDKHDLLYELQHSFREKGHAKHSLKLPCWSRTLQGMQMQASKLILYCWTSRRPLIRLIWKLHQYGIRGNALSWIRAFLGNRSLTVVLEGEESGSIPVTSGVPKGSILEPILFLVYISDLPGELSSQVRIFADDTAVYTQMEARRIKLNYKLILTDCLCGGANRHGV